MASKEIPEENAIYCRQNYDLYLNIPYWISFLKAAIPF